MSILVESDIGRWLDPTGAPAIDLRAAVESRAVVYFALESDRMLEALISRRQNVPTSAELVADIAGASPAWLTTQGTEHGLLGQRASGRGTRRRDYEREIHPALIQRLGVGEAVVVRLGEQASRRAVVARLCRPGEVRAPRDLESRKRLLT